MYIRLNKNINTIVYFLILISPIVDNINGYILLKGGSTNLSSYLKSIIFIFSIISICRLGIARKNAVKNIVTLLFLGTSVLYCFLVDRNSLMFNINNTIKLLMFFVLYAYYEKFEDINFDRLMKYFSWFYPISLLIPRFLSIGFSTYRYDSIGNKGFYYAGNEISTIMFVLLVYSLKKVTYSFSMLSLIMLFLNIVSSFFIGTKSVIIAFSIALFFFIMSYLKKRGVMLKVVALLLICTFLALLMKNLYMPYLEDLFNVWKNRFFYHNNSLFDFLLSGRNKKLYEIKNIVVEYGLVDMLLGRGAYFFTIVLPMVVEMDFIDLVLWYGILGAGNVVLILFSYFKPLFMKVDFFGRITVVILFLISFVSGHILFAPSVTIVIATWLQYSKQNECAENSRERR